LKAVALHAVYHIARAVDVPIIGTGGVTSGEDALELMAAGATAVGVGSAVSGEGPEVFTRLLDEMTRWLDSHDMSASGARGRAQGNPYWAEAPSRPPVPHDPATLLATPADSQRVAG
jgi:dihydroorotate dehydrogenase (NAD+) catalytic subunit